jgi:hypothetical protein
MIYGSIPVAHHSCLRTISSATFGRHCYPVIKPDYYMVLERGSKNHHPDYKWEERSCYNREPCRYTL